jgi:hypothetical protein
VVIEMLDMEKPFPFLRRLDVDDVAAKITAALAGDQEKNVA